MNMMGALMFGVGRPVHGLMRYVGAFAGPYPAFDFPQVAFAHPDVARPCRDRPGEKPIAPGARVANALRNAREPYLERRALRIWQNQAGIGLQWAQLASHRP